MKKTSRRDFLKLAAIAPAAMALSKFVSLKSLRPRGNANQPSVIILVFDAMSASNLSLYNYPRKTAPNFERFAQRANVYNAHYSAANFTTPGVSSMLTGLYPWTHRAYHLSGLIARDLIDRNIFEAFGEEYWRFAFSQNVWAYNLLEQCRSQIDEFLPPSSFSRLSFLPSELFKNDANNAHQIQDDLLFDFVDSPASLLFGLAHRLYFEGRKRKMHSRDFPRGIPQPRNYPVIYQLEDVFDGLYKTLGELTAPYFSYIHIFSPHSPYRARRDFIGIFDDGWKSIRKPDHVFSEGETYDAIEQNRVWYDEYIANVDFEFGHLLDRLEQAGMLDNSYLVATSDHGELLERGVKGHVTPLLYEPLVRVPLLISSPGQTQGKRIDSPTVSVDLLPTLMTLIGRKVPNWVEGRLLPGLGGVAEPQRDVYMLEAKSSSAFGKLTRATFAMRKGRYKIILFHGYKEYGEDAFEIYDLENDPQEMDDLFGKKPSLTQELRAGIMKKFYEINQPHPA